MPPNTSATSDRYEAVSDNHNNNHRLTESSFDKTPSKWEPQVKAKRPDAGRWVRPLSIMESYWVNSTKYSCINTVQALWLSSAQPLHPDLLTKAVHRVTSNLELMQTCIQKRRRRYWFRKMDTHQFNLTVCYEDPMNIYNSLLHSPFNLKEGPLWKAYVSLSSSSRNEAVLLLCIHHSITDGSTNLIILRDILRTLNAFYRNEEIQLEFKPVPPPLMDHLLHTYLHIPYVVKEFFKNPFISLVLSRSNPVRVIRGNTTPMTTRVLASELSAEITANLIKRCKDARVTVNSCFVAAARLAMFRLVQFYKPDCKEIKMAVENLVNMRRYLPPEYDEIMGCFVSSEGQRFKVTDKHLEDFSKLANKINEIQKRHLDRRVPFKRMQLFKILNFYDYVNNWFTKKGYRNMEACQLGITNMGNLEKYLPAEIETHVKVTNYVRSVSIQNGPSMCLLSCHTLRGKLMISLDYSTNRLTDEMARLLSDYLLAILQSVAENSAIST